MTWEEHLDVSSERDTLLRRTLDVLEHKPVKACFLVEVKYFGQQVVTVEGVSPNVPRAKFQE